MPRFDLSDPGYAICVTDVGPGDVLAGRYRLEGALGSGGSATVYAARDTVLDRDVAVKVWRDGGEGVAESQLTARLHHPGVVVVHDVRTEDEVSFLVMERVDGSSLANLLANGPLPPDRAARIVAQLAAVLARVHADGIVHGDVKPANVLLGKDDAVTLTDFGVAAQASFQRSDVALGTPQYLSPEQVLGEPITAATDVYALGLVLLECLTATHAFSGTDTEVAAARLSNAPDVPLSVPPDLAALVHRTTTRHPERRPTAAQVAAQLEGRAADETRLLPVALPVAAGGGVDRTRQLMLAGAAIIVGALLLGVLGARGDSGTPRKPTPTQPPVVHHSTTPTAHVVAPPPAHRHGKHKGK